jgi:hypothetical protein
MAAADRIEGLYRLPLGEFTAARNELARELRRDGDAADAERVGKLKKPTLPAWAINNLPRAEVRRVLEAGRRLRDAQEAALRGEPPAGLKGAAAAEREAVRRAAEKAASGLGSKATAANLERVRGSLHAAASDAEVREAIEAGRLDRDHEPVGLGPLGAPGGHRPRRTRAPSGKELREARQAERHAARHVAAAEREVEKQRAASERARQRVAAAETELAEARAAAEAAAARLAKAEGRRRG